ncbi:site-specific DNA-methyltransferase [Candidatus Gracilibacteria bacterium]|nr:site-specific DNA-methyltransferase [Candidatus Gracilibacteria bacterium]
MEVMKQFNDKEFDLAIIDPPYGIESSGKSFGAGSGKLKNRVLNKNSKKIIEWDNKPGDDYFTELFRISKNQIIWGYNYFYLPPTRCVICWDKVQPWDNFSQIELAWTSFNHPAKLFRFDNRTGDKIHPTQKPVKLYEWLLTNFATKGDKILDTHFGSLSIGIACDILNFDLTAIEIDKTYYQAGKKRLLDHKSQLKFDIDCL